MHMTEEQIERIVESKMNALDRALGRLTQVEYDAEVKALDKWAENEYKTMKKG